MPQIEWKFEFGNLLTIALFLVSVSVIYGNFSSRLDVVEKRGTEESIRYERLLEEIRVIQRQIVKLETKEELRDWRKQERERELTR